MYRYLSPFLFLIIPSLHTSDFNRQCAFVYHRQNDSTAVLWHINLHAEVAKQFVMYKNYFDDPDVSKDLPVACKASAQQIPALTQSTAKKLFAIAQHYAEIAIMSTSDQQTQKPLDVDTLVSSPCELELMVRMASMLEAVPAINHALLSTKHAQTFIHELFVPQPKKWYWPFSYHVQSSDGVSDLQKYVTKTVATSEVLKKKYKSFMYNWLYTCTEWQEADTGLNNAQDLRVIYQDSILSCETMLRCFDPWQKSVAFQTYNEMFPEDRLSELCDRYLSECKNLRDYITTLRNSHPNNVKCCIFGLTGEYNPHSRFFHKTELTLQKYSNTAHIPFIYHFISRLGWISFVGHKQFERLVISEPATILSAVDIKVLKKIHFPLCGTLDPDSLIALSKEYDSKDDGDVKFLRVGKEAIEILRKTYYNLPNCYDGFRLPSWGWRWKIAEPWSVLCGLWSASAIISKCASVFIKSWAHHRIERTFNAMIKDIDALGISQHIYTMITALNSSSVHPFDGRILEYIQTKANPLCLQNSYSTEMTRVALDSHKKIWSLYSVFTDSCSFITDCQTIVPWVIPIGLFFFTLYLYNNSYKWYRPHARLYNPLKLFFPLKFSTPQPNGTMGYDNDHIPIACTLHE